MICRICEMQTCFLEKVEGCIAGKANAQLYTKPHKMSVCDVDLYKCAGCGHVQTEYLLDEKYYDEYNLLINYFYHEKILDERLQKLHSYKKSGTFIDIGCGKGDTLVIAKKYYDECVGVEPSAEECRIARGRGLNVIQAYVDEGFTHKMKYDVFTCNMVLEHLENPKAVLGKINDLLTDEGVGLINIPNGEKIIRQGLYHQLITEHINYYSVVSICKLAELCGFEVMEIEKDDNLLELNVYVRKVKCGLGISEKKKSHKKQLEEWLKNCKNITLYGGGTKAHTYSFLFENLCVRAIVDSDHKKYGKYINGIDIPISEATEEVILKSDAIVILASSYNNEIITKITNMGYSGKICFFDHGDNSVRLFEAV